MCSFQLDKAWKLFIYGFNKEKLSAQSTLLKWEINTLGRLKMPFQRPYSSKFSRGACPRTSLAACAFGARDSGLNISVCTEEQVPLSIKITLSICFLLPFTVMLMLYPIIIYHLWTRQVPGEPNALQQQRANRMARKITKMMVAVVLSFFVCWAPQFIFVWMYPLARELAATLPWLFPFILWLQVLNSAMNPVLYAIFNESFRLGFKKVIFGSILRKRNGQVMQSARNQNPIQNIALIRFQNSAGLQR